MRLVLKTDMRECFLLCSRFSAVSLDFKFCVSICKLLWLVLTAVKQSEYAVIQVRSKKLQCKCRFPEWWSESEGVAETSSIPSPLKWGQYGPASLGTLET